MISQLFFSACSVSSATYGLSSIESPSSVRLSSSTFAPYIISLLVKNLTSLFSWLYSSVSAFSKFLARLPSAKNSKSSSAISRVALALLSAFACFFSLSILFCNTSISARINSVSIISTSLRGSISPSV